MPADNSVTKPVFQPVVRVTLREIVAHQIRATIFTGRVLPGDRLVESSLAKDLCVAQSTVREAIFDLVSEGLLVKEANRHTRVRSLDSCGVRVLLAVRLQLEPLAIELAVARNAPDRLDELESQVEIMRKSARDNDLPTFFEADIRFHATLQELTDNDVLVQAMKPLSIAPIVFILSGLRTVQEVAYQPLAEEHQAVVDVMRKGDPKAAAALMRAHIESWHALQLSAKQESKESGVETA